MVEYEVKDGQIVITGCSNDEVNLELPDEIDGKPVAFIEPNTCINKKGLKRVVIPSTCRVVGQYAFAGCENIEELILEDGVEIIEDWAFISTNITSITLPESLKSIGSNAFLGSAIKAEVDAFMQKMTNLRRPKNHTNNKCCLLSLDAQEHKKMLNDTYIMQKSKLVDKQFDKLQEGEITELDLDIPYLFDGEEFLLALYNRKPLEDIKLEIAGESTSLIGLYDYNDPDFIEIHINVLTKGMFITSFIVKVPYLEAIDFEILSSDFIQTEGMYYYYLHVKANLQCYGSGNYEREFAINYYDHMLKKYENSFNNKRLELEDYQYIQEKINERIRVTSEGFIKEIDGAPRLLYVINLINKIVEDDDLLEFRIKIQDIYTKLLDFSYNNLSTIDSLVDLCFDYSDSIIKEIVELIGISTDDLNVKYNLELSDAVGNPVSEDEMPELKEKLIDNQNNYILHGQFITYELNELRAMNDDFINRLFKLEIKDE